MSFIVGIGSKAQQGKSTLARALCSHPLLLGAQHYSFAGALKAYARVTGLMREKNPTVLQALGGIYLNHDPNFWIRILELQLADDQPPVAIISDLCYRNEHAWIKAHAGLTVSVVRLNVDGSRYLSPDRDARHPSETDLDDLSLFDYRIQARSGELAHLASCADALAARIASRIALRKEE